MYIFKGKSLIKNYGFFFFIFIFISLFMTIFLFYFKFYNSLQQKIHIIIDAKIKLSHIKKKTKSSINILNTNNIGNNLNKNEENSKKLKIRENRIKKVDINNISLSSKNKIKDVQGTNIITTLNNKIDNKNYE